MYLSRLFYSRDLGLASHFYYWETALKLSERRWKAFGLVKLGFGPYISCHYLFLQILSTHYPASGEANISWGRNDELNGI